MRRLRRQIRRRIEKTGVQDVRRQVEGVVQIRQRQVTGGDAVVAGENFSEDSPGARQQLGEPGGRLHCLPALSLGVAPVRHGCSQSSYEHAPL